MLWLLKMPHTNTSQACVNILLEAAAAADAVQGLLKAAIDPAIAAWLNKTPGRAPNKSEIAKGVPANFCVKEVPRKDGSRVDKYYFHPNGTCFRSIAAIVRWRKANSGSDTDGAASRPATPPTKNPVYRVYTSE